MEETFFFMDRCFELARRSAGQNQPNPMVGAVIVCDGKIVGEGFHKKFGGKHAEIHALESVASENKHLLSHATLYVTLEPCSHHGKTPPCADAIIASGIKKVVVGLTDPNPLVRGKGIQKLKEAGVDVSLFPDGAPAFDLIRPFLAHLSKRPYTILKCVKSKDNYIGRKGEKVWLSNSLAGVLSHDWRSQTDAILVGKNTVITDNPALTVRNVSGKDPIRVLIDPNLECDPGSQIFNSPGKVIVFNHVKSGQTDHIQHIKIEPGEHFEKDLLEVLFNHKIYSLLVEGGAKVIHSFYGKGLWDEARVIDTPVLLTEGIPAPMIEGRLATTTLLGDNTVRIIHPTLSFPVPHEKSLQEAI